MNGTRKTAVVLFFLLLLVGAAPGFGLSADGGEYDTPGNEELKRLVSEQAAELNLEEIEDYLRRVDPYFEDYLPRRDLRSFAVELIQRGLDFDPVGFFRTLSTFFFREFIGQFQLLGRLLILALLSAVLHCFARAFDEGGLSEVARAVIFLTLVLVALASFREAVGMGRQVVADLTGFMRALLPVLLSLLVALGNVVSFALFRPLTFAIVSLIGAVINDLLFPMIFVAAVLVLVGHMTRGFDLSRLAELIRSANIVLLGCCFTAFMGIMVIQGVAGSVADGVSLRTAKFLTGSLIPILGSMFADAVDIVLGSSLLIKNAVGLAGVLVIFFLVAAPVLRILVLVIVYKLAGALIQPVCDEDLVRCINEMGNILILVMLSVITVALMFFITLTILVGIGNMGVMLR